MKYQIIVVVMKKKKLEIETNLSLLTQINYRKKLLKNEKVREGYTKI